MGCCSLLPLLRLESAHMSRHDRQHPWYLMVIAMGIFVSMTQSCTSSRERALSTKKPPTSYDPFRQARETLGTIYNQDTSVPPMCYTNTQGDSNPCWVCHTVGQRPNVRDDFDLQRTYSFSASATTNHWSNLFIDRGAEIDAISDASILDYIRTDNYSPLRVALSARPDTPGWKPDLDFSKGFDAQGFALDGSGWRAIRYKPFPGAFWPTNGSSDDTYIRLPHALRHTNEGTLSLDVYRVNLSILEAAITAQVDGALVKVSRDVEPLDESLAGFDLDQDGHIGGTITHISALPPRFIGAGSHIETKAHTYPEGTEFLHTVRYVDTEAPGLLSARMKEVRYSKKVEALDTWALQRAYEREDEEKDEGRASITRGSPFVGLRNGFGWQFQAYIEDSEGWLRLQTEEEHRFCLGCHSNLGVTIDQTFAFPRKLPGSEGWRQQDLKGQQDPAQRGHREPETLTYFRRVHGADELRGNQEMIDRFFPGGRLDEAQLNRVAQGGDQDLAWLLTPSPERARNLAKAYRAIVATQSFRLGRDAMISPARNVHRQITPGPTALAAAQNVFLDGTLLLDWPSRASALPHLLFSILRIQSLRLRHGAWPEK